MRNPMLFLPISLTVVFLLSPTMRSDADVTVVMSGGWNFTEGLNIPSDRLRVLNSIANQTFYFRNSKVRSDSASISEIDDFATNTAMTVNNERRIYAISKMGSAQTAAVGSLFGIDTKHSERAITHHESVIHYGGHKCLRRIVTEEVTYSDTGGTIEEKIDLIEALDVNGYVHPRARNGKLVSDGIPIDVTLSMVGPGGGMTMRTTAVSISSAKLPDADFAIGRGYRLASQTEVMSDGADGSDPVMLSGFMSSKPADPYAALNESTGPAKVKALIAKGHFDDATPLVRALMTRGYNKQLAPVFQLLGDHSTAVGKTDEAWGWYNLVVQYSDDPTDIVAARFGLAKYYTDYKDNDNARKQLQAIVDLPSASQDDKDKAAQQLSSLNQ